MDRKQQVMDLWRSCFDDSDEFIDMFFSQVYKDENEFTIDKEGDVISALQVVPYTMTFYDKEISVGYICGACTAVQERGAGHMTHLVNESLQIMKNREVALAVTIPATSGLFDLYRKSGFIEAFTYSKDTFIIPDPPIAKSHLTVIEPEVPTTQEMYDFFNRKLRERNCCVLHSYDNFISVIRDYQLSGGHILAAIDDNEKIKGLAFILTPPQNAEHDKDAIYVTEVLFEDLQTKFFILQEAIRQFGAQKAIYRCLSFGMSNAPFGMAKVLDRERMINIWLHAHKNSEYKYEDLKDMNIENLTQLLLGYKQQDSYMSLMFDQ